MIYADIWGLQVCIWARTTTQLLQMYKSWINVKKKIPKFFYTAFHVREREYAQSYCSCFSPWFVRSWKAFLHLDICKRNNPLVSTEKDSQSKKGTIFEHFSLGKKSLRSFDQISLTERVYVSVRSLRQRIYGITVVPGIIAFLWYRCTNYYMKIEFALAFCQLIFLFLRLRISFGFVTAENKHRHHFRQLNRTLSFPSFLKVGVF